MAENNRERVLVEGDRAEEPSRDARIRDVRDRIHRWTREGEGGVDTEVRGLTLFRMDAVTGSLDRMYEPSVTLVAQGTKRVLLGDEELAYGPGQLAITTVDLPVEPQIVAASTEQPYLCLSLEIDPTELAKLMAEDRLPRPRSASPDRALFVTDAPAPLLDSFRRLLDVLDDPEDLPVLAPLILREIAYRLLVGEQGERLREAVSVGSHTQRIARAITHLKEDIRGSVDVEELAERVGMGASTFYRHFRTVTAMSPLQYQKRLRLREAQRLMIAEGLDAASAGFRVGYESPSQFSRDYRRQFGDPPARHVSNLLHAT